jgi:acetyltransferase-like isoleucine patch superfamily enzyme
MQSVRSSTSWQRGMLLTLWVNRCDAGKSARDIVKRWLRRVHSVPILCREAIRRRRYIMKGHEIAPLTVVHCRPLAGPGILRVGDETSIMGDVHIYLYADVKIGSRVVIGDGVKLLTSSQTLGTGWQEFAKPIVIEDHAWVAENSIIMPGVTIGRGAVIGAGSVVHIDVPEYSIAFGNPARLYPVRRPGPLDYSPIRDMPVFEAWLGPQKAPIPKHQE